MEQRPLRLGDLVDDYCPRERRITNHAIVAIIENAIRQTRCSTCEAEHVYKAAKVPRRRKPEGAVVDDAEAVSPAARAATAPATDLAEAVLEDAGALTDEGAAMVAAGVDAEEGEADGGVDADSNSGPGDLGSSHRRLIRATLPKVEGGEPPPRPIPEFTMHQRQSRGSHMFRGGQGMPGANGQSRGGFRHGRPVDGNGNGNGPVHGQGGGRGQGPGSGQDQGDGQGGGPGRGGRSGRRRGQSKRPR